MPTLVLKNLPTGLLERLFVRAASRRRSVNQEAIALLDEALRSESGSVLPTAAPTTAGWRRLVGKWSDGDEGAKLANEIQRRRTGGRKVDL